MSLSPVTEVDDDLEHGGKPAGPCAMVVFGATGDLTMRKLVPALYNLEKASLLPKEFAVLGVAIDDLSLEDFRKKATRFLQAEDHGTEAWDRFQQCLHYLRGDFGDEATYAKLGAALAAIDEQHGTSQNYLFYMATSPKFFCDIVQHLGQIGPFEGGRRSLAQSGHREAVRPGPRFGDGAQSEHQGSACRKSRSIASTIIWAKKPCRTSWSSASATESSSRFGTVATSITSRSPMLKPSASKCAGATSMPPELCATWFPIT